MTDSTPIPPPSEPPRPRAPDRRPPPPSSTGFGCLLPTVLIALFGSLLVNLFLGIFLLGQIGDSFDDDPVRLEEKVFLGDRSADDKIAVIRLEGLISEYTMKYPIRQMEKAAKDRHVKAVVLRVDSPGGTVSASEELYQNLVSLRDNTDRRFKGTGPKPVSVSFGGV